MKNIYIYPKVKQECNPYISDLELSLSKYYNIINRNINNIGVIDLFKNIFITDIYFLNWIEDIPVKRYGKIQSIVFLFFLKCIKILKKKIVWTMHNRYSHDTRYAGWKIYLFNNLIKNSDLIITHSTKGIDLIGEIRIAYLNKTKYFIHPIKPAIIINSKDHVKFDFLIWGSITPYKGIIEFLKFLFEKKLSHLRVVIIGYCQDRNYKKEIDKYLSSNIIYYNEFIPLDEIALFASQAKYILFTHKTESVLSSGSLMDSIRMGSVIIGPNTGSFRDLCTYSFIRVYNSFEDIIDIYENYHYDKQIIYKEIYDFCDNNTWDSFSNNVYESLEELC